MHGVSNKVEEGSENAAGPRSFSPALSETSRFHVPVFAFSLVAYVFASMLT